LSGRNVPWANGIGTGIVGLIIGGIDGGAQRRRREDAGTDLRQGSDPVTVGQDRNRCGRDSCFEGFQRESASVSSCRYANERPEPREKDVPAAFGTGPEAARSPALGEDMVAKSPPEKTSPQHWSALRIRRNELKRTGREKTDRLLLSLVKSDRYVGRLLYRVPVGQSIPYKFVVFSARFRRHVQKPFRGDRLWAGCATDAPSATTKRLSAEMEHADTCSIDCEKLDCG
jgi:hypothetical protein